MVCVLTCISVVCGSLLAYIYGLTEAPIQAANDKALADGITAVMGGGTVKVEDPNGTEIVRNVDGKDLTFTVYKTDKGTAVKSTDPNAFGGNLTILVGFDEKCNILGYTVLENNETPGLGAKCPDWFQKGNPGNIIGMNPGKNNMTVSKDGGEVDAITASTITSRAFLRAVQQAYATLAESADSTTGATKQENK